jgi:hypothetical protein
LAAASLLGVLLASLAAMSGLVVWHLVRRGRLVLNRLSNPRPIDWPEFENQAPDPDRPNIREDREIQT